eukprot:5953778-Pyramimonas_sp.AAC.1
MGDIFAIDTCRPTFEGADASVAPTSAPGKLGRAAMQMAEGPRQGRSGAANGGAAILPFLAS